jgi:hypothetical protein
MDKAWTRGHRPADRYHSPVIRGGNSTRVGHPYSDPCGKLNACVGSYSDSSAYNGDAYFHAHAHHSYPHFSPPKGHPYIHTHAHSYPSSANGHTYSYPHFKVDPSDQLNGRF